MFLKRVSKTIDFALRGMKQKNIPNNCVAVGSTRCYISQSVFAPSEINFNNFEGYLNANAGKNDYVEVFLSGFLKIDYSEIYTFKSETQRESLNLYIDDELIISSSNQTDEGTLYLSSGWHKIGHLRNKILR